MSVAMLKHSVWMFLGRNTYGLRLLNAYVKLIDKDINTTSNRTAIVIEGYPRCANTRFVAAFRLAQPRQVNIAHHVHGPQQILAGLKTNIPVVLLIRSPVEAVTSLIIRDESIKPAHAFQNYIKFYKPLLPFIDNLVVSDFEMSTNRIDDVIHEVNLKYKSIFRTLNEANINESAIREAVIRMDMVDRGSLVESTKTSGTPSSERKILAEALKEEILTEPGLKDLIARSRAIYEQVIRKP
ncbi:MAG: hypothetical protein KJO81_02135 [Gammaproteobacteria bacterium]|nr:hypothetical protein [Gammaproteobacteria bacterium]MBT8123605.1 hypothetical protein [Gammaproteobacteria bacterium]